jgi:hypothetical protein
VALIISGTGKRVAESANGAAGAEPKLHVEYSTGGPPPNQPPNVNAGEDQFITLPAMANLDGTVTDDGLPDPPGAFTVLWTKVSGPGTVTFGNAALIDTTATFSQAGTYVLRLTGDDGPLDSSDEVTIVANAAGGTTSVNVRVGIGDDDAEEHIASGTVTRFSSDLEMVEDGSPVVIGLRFVGVPIPQDATITAAHVQFQVDEATSGATSLLIQGHAVDNAPPIVSSAFNISSRSRTSAMVAWNPPTWGSVGAAGADQRTTDLSTVIQEIVSREGWSPDNSLMLIITGTGERVAEAWDGGDPSVAPLLHVQYTIDGGSEGSQSPGSRTSN